LEEVSAEDWVVVWEDSAEVSVVVSAASEESVVSVVSEG
jgi:hypothetical protein